MVKAASPSVTYKVVSADRFAKVSDEIDVILFQDRSLHVNARIYP